MWLKNWRAGRSQSITSFDLSAAFDTLCPSTLLDKLKIAGVTGVPLKWFESYLSDHSQNVLWNGNLSKPLPLNRGVPQGSILGPILFLAMIHDMPEFLTRETLVTSSKVMGYADDTTVYIKARSVKHLMNEMEWLRASRVNYCNKNGLVLNSQKTQIWTTAKKEIEIKIDKNTVLSTPTISLLGLEYDSNFSTVPYLRKLAREANTRAALIQRLSFGMPNFLLKPLTNGLLMGKLLSAATAAIPIKLCMYDKPYLAGILNDLEKSIRSAARTISRSKLTDKIRSEVVLQKAGLRSLTEAVCVTMATTIWKARKKMNQLGCVFNNRLFLKNTRSMSSNNLCQPIPGHPEAAVNKLAQVWNLMNLGSAKTLGCAKTLAQKWYRQCSKNLLS